VFARRPQETREEGVKHICFLVIVSNFTTIMFKDMDIVLTKALTGTGMEESSIFISFDGSADFASLLLELQFFVDSPRKDPDNNH